MLSLSGSAYWRLLEPGRSSLHCTSCTCIRVNLQQPTVDIHDISKNWPRNRRMVSGLPQLCWIQLYGSANSKTPFSSPLLGLMAATIYQSPKNLVTRKCCGARSSIQLPYQRMS
ncbi:hypothetical protein BYT27DRAFT_6341071 [Phlegmacium glaucopus]|nr:hypothetical protein BYT27DRAFT_6341071 [Phlegmacium glaucopus]